MTDFTYVKLANRTSFLNIFSGSWLVHSIFDRNWELKNAFIMTADEDSKRDFENPRGSYQESV